MRITIETIPHEDQRPGAGINTIGDWQFDAAGNLAISVSALGDPDYEFLIGLHEMIEAWLCHKHGIRQEEVDAFDRSHTIWDEPGEHPEAPYRMQHRFAELVERLMAHELGADWAQYGDAINALP